MESDWLGLGCSVSGTGRDECLDREGRASPRTQSELDPELEERAFMLCL